ncbi:BRCC3 [Symbiodinium sp. CCMP2592]|nr:BRCC3 [Symbiodinium sp. CCMP2592]
MAEGGRLLLSEQVYHACLAHALMSENEEIMGLLLGDVEGSEVRIWCSMTLRRSDKQPDRVEIAPEQLVEAVHVADELNKVLQCRTRVLGWYHSHPHITCFPSHVDLRTQLEYQIMDADFVGLIFGVFNYGDSGGIHHELIAFRTHEEGGQHQQRNLAVEVVPLCQLLSQEDEAAAVQLQEFGGFFGQSTICTVAEHTLAEVLEVQDGGKERNKLEAGTAPVQEDQEDPEVSLSRLRQKATLIGTLFRVAGESIAPLEGYFQDSTKNFQVYSKIWDKPQEEPEAETLGAPDKSKTDGLKEAELSTPKAQQTVEIVNGSPAPTEREDETPEQKSAASVRLSDQQGQQSKEDDEGGPETFVSSSSSFLSSILPDGGRDSGAADPASHAMDCSGAPESAGKEGSGQVPSVPASARVPPDADNITTLKNNFGEPGYCLCQLNLRSEYDTPRKCSRKSSPSALRCTQHLNSQTPIPFCNELHLDWSCVQADLQNGAFRVEFRCDTLSSRRHPDAVGAKDKRPPDRNFSAEVFGNGALKAVADYVAGKSYEALTKLAEPPTKKPRTR